MCLSLSLSLSIFHSFSLISSLTLSLVVSFHDSSQLHLVVLTPHSTWNSWIPDQCYLITHAIFLHSPSYLSPITQFPCALYARSYPTRSHFGSGLSSPQSQVLRSTVTGSGLRSCCKKSGKTEVVAWEAFGFAMRMLPKRLTGQVASSIALTIP